jgi:hypothetical protein
VTGPLTFRKLRGRSLRPASPRAPDFCQETVVEQVASKLPLVVDSWNAYEPLK